MNFEEWFEKDGQDFEKCEGMTQDERNMAEKAWNACKAECIKKMKSSITGSSDHDTHREEWAIEAVMDDIEDEI